MQKRFTLIISFLFLLLFSVACSNNQSANQSSEKKAAPQKNHTELIISAAASLKDAMTDIQSTYEKEHPEVTLKMNYGSSGALAQQISQGAPADLFFSADEKHFNQLVTAGNIAKKDGVQLLGNKLVLIVPKNEQSGVTKFQDLSKKDVNKLSIGTPETVPAGKYAKESLTKIGIWKNIEAKIVYAKDVRQVLSYVETGNVNAGIVYKTDALISNKVKVVATANANTHTPIIYPVGVIKDSKQYKAAKDFYHYLQSEEALKVFKKYGFITE